jgi:hypothetical protein
MPSANFVTVRSRVFPESPAEVLAAEKRSAIANIKMRIAGPLIFRFSVRIFSVRSK